MGDAAKIDILDAKALAFYGCERHKILDLFVPVSPHLLTLYTLVQRRHDLRKILGKLYSDLGRHEIAKELSEKSLNVYKQEFPENHKSVAQVTALFGRLFVKIGNYDEGRKLYSSSLKIYEDHYGKNHMKTVKLVDN